jgi:NAD(P)H-hydrate epimerase
MSLPYHAGRTLTVAEVRDLDRLAIEECHLPGIVLMENAGRNIAEAVYQRLAAPAAASVLILVGPGNNGGDGLVVARQLHNAGVRVTALRAVPEHKLRGDARTNLQIAKSFAFPLRDASAEPALDLLRDQFESATVIVDALLGTGSSGNPRGTLGALIELANAVDALRVAVDVPTGLDADTGAPGEPTFRAHLTVTMAARKQGFDAPQAQAFTGEVEVVDIGLPAERLPR